MTTPNLNPFSEAMTHYSFQILLTLAAVGASWLIIRYARVFYKIIAVLALFLGIGVVWQVKIVGDFEEAMKNFTRTQEGGRVRLVWAAYLREKEQTDEAFLARYAEWPLFLDAVRQEDKAALRKDFDSDSALLNLYPVVFIFNGRGELLYASAAARALPELAAVGEDVTRKIEGQEKPRPLHWAQAASGRIYRLSAAALPTKAGTHELQPATLWIGQELNSKAIEDVDRSLTGSAVVTKVPAASADFTLPLEGLENKPEAYLSVVVSDVVPESLTTITLNTSLVLLFVFSLSALLMGMVGFYLKRPLDVLMMGMKGLVKGVYKPVTIPEGGEEISAAVRTYNQMVERLKERDHAVELRSDLLRRLNTLSAELSQLFNESEIGEALVKVIKDVIPDLQVALFYQQPGKMGYQQFGDAQVPDMHSSAPEAADRPQGLRYIPLSAEGKTFGRLAIRSDAATRSLLDAENDFLASTCYMGALAFDNARLVQRLHDLSITDELTGLANRRQFVAYMEREISRAYRYNYPITLLMFDLDWFKQVNDSYGHLAGDAALKLVAEVLRKFVRASDLVARYGGEEFALVLPHTPKSAAAETAGRIRQTFEELGFEFDGQKIPLKVSGGVATLPDECRDMLSLVRLADDRLYKAKESGRNKIVA